MLSPAPRRRAPSPHAERVRELHIAMHDILAVLESGRPGKAADMLRAGIRGDQVLRPADDDPYGDGAA
jgi:hypothetical protein